MPSVDDLPETFWAYLAGIIDGEGTISVYSIGAQLTIANTHLPLLVTIQEKLGCGSIQTLGMRGGRTSQAYKWGCYATGLRRILPKILPYLIIKKPHAELMLEFLDPQFRRKTGTRVSNTEAVRRAGIKGQFKALNHRNFAIHQEQEATRG